MVKVHFAFEIEVEKMSVIVNVRFFFVVSDVVDFEYVIVVFEIVIVELESVEIVVVEIAAEKDKQEKMAVIRVD